MFVQHRKIQNWEDPQVFLRIWEENGEVSTIARSRKIEFQVSPEKESWTGIRDCATSLNHTITWAMLVSPMQQIHLTMRSTSFSYKIIGISWCQHRQIQSLRVNQPSFLLQGPIRDKSFELWKAFHPFWSTLNISTLLRLLMYTVWKWVRFKPLFAVNTYCLRNKTIPKYDFCV